MIRSNKLYSKSIGIKAILIAIMLIHIFASISFAQRYPFRIYNVKEGMSQSQINDIVQDNDGYLWYASAEGINCFNGQEFKHFGKSDGLAGSFVNKILLDREGNLWFGHRFAGISRYLVKEKLFEEIPLPSGLESVGIEDIIETNDGSLWFATSRHGLFKYESGKWRIFNKEDGLLSNKLLTLCSVNNEIWIGSDRGVNTLNLDQSERETISIKSKLDRLEGKRISALLCDHEQNIWICTAKSGVYRFIPDFTINMEDTLLHVSESLNFPQITPQCIMEDNEYYIWIGTKGKGVIRCSREYSNGDRTVVIIDRKNGLDREDIPAIFQDREGSFWFGTNGGGVYQYRGKCFEKFGEMEGLLDDVIWAVFEDDSGGFWFGSENGLTHVKYGEEWRDFNFYSSDQWKGDNSILDIESDDEGNLWLVVHRTGIRVLNPKTKRFHKIPELENKNVICMEKGNENDFWFGTFQNGVYYLNLDSAEIKNYQAGDGLASNTVFDINKSSNGDIWFATNSAGITKYDGSTFINYDSSYGFNVTSVLTLTENSIGVLWIGTEGEGLYRYDGHEFQNYSEKYGLWKDDIYSVICDNQDNVFIGTRRGIEKFNPEENKIKRYGDLEGFLDIETNQNAIYKDSAGHLWFGTIQGAIRYNPAEDRQNHVPPGTYIDNIRVFLQDLPLPEDSSFAYTDNHLTFNFLGLSFVAPENIRYSYMLEGLDREWSPLSIERYATYANLTPGKYSFKVKSINNDGVWSKKAAVYQFSINAPFWQQGWFYVFIIFVFGVSIYGIHRYRVRKIYRNNMLLEEMVHSRTSALVAEKEKAQAAVDALRESEEKYATFIRYSTEAIWCIDLKNPIPVKMSVKEQIDRIVRDAYLSECNDAMANLYGYDSADEIIGRSSSKGLLRAVPENRHNLHQFISSGYRLKNAEFKEIDKSDNVKIMLVGFTGILEKGHLVRAWGMQRDITQQRRAEEALKESEEMYRRLIERSPDAILVHSEGRIDYINKAGVKLYGGTNVSDFLGHKLTDLSHPEFRELGQMRVQQIYQEKKEVGLMEQKMVRIDGSEFDVEVMGAPIIYNGRASGQSIVRDITERKKMEAELQKAQKLDSVGILAGGIAHDFNNILTAILGNISLGKMYSEPQGEAYVVLSEAEKATLQAKDLTQQLLTFSKGGAPVKETTSIYEIIKDSANFVLRGSNIDAEYDYSPDLWSVDVDAAQISQVVQNLIINAEQAMPDGKKISIKLKNIELTNAQFPGIRPGKFVEVRIVDKGIGISDEHLNKIFDPYFTTKQRGSGLGLATSYSIIKRHGGHINVKSKIGMGTEVLIYIPASDKQAPEKKSMEEKILAGNGRILVMDDEDMLLQVSEQFLSHLGYQVCTVSDGESAIKEYKRACKEGSPFSLVIVDLTIPGGMGGKETMKELQKIDPKVRAIVSSGYSNDPVMAHYSDYGFRAILTKPYKIETMSAVIAEVINNHSA